MTDYLERIAAAKADIARLKGEKEAFEQSNAPDDLDEEDLKNWNYAKDLERQMRELKAEHKDALKELAKLEKAAAKARATEPTRNAALQPRACISNLCSTNCRRSKPRLRPTNKSKNTSPKPAPAFAR